MVDKEKSLEVEEVSDDELKAVALGFKGGSFFRICLCLEGEIILYYRLKDDYILRGWNKLPYAIVNVKTKRTFFITAKTMQAVNLCDGNMDIADSFIPDEIKNVIEKCEKGNGLKENQKYKKYPSRYIEAVQWSVTGKCNFKCRHCYMSAPDVNAKELPHEDIIKIINQLAENGVMTVYLTGGEPLFRDDFLEIIDAFLEHDIKVERIYSNGALITKKLLTELYKRNVHPEFCMSYDGVDGWHDWLTGIKGAGELTSRAFELCRDMGFDTAASIIIHEGNKHTVRDTVNHLASLGVSRVGVGFAADMGEWIIHNENKKLSIKDFLQTLLDYIPQYYEDGMPVDISLGIFRANKNESDKYQVPFYVEEYDPDKLICDLIRRSAYISPEGRVLTCGLCAGLRMQGDFPTLFEKNFSECISTPEYMKIADMRVQDFLKVNEKCRTCKFTRHCYGGCRIQALIHNNESSLIGTCEDICELFYGGWIKKIVDTVKKACPTAECPVKDSSLL